MDELRGDKWKEKYEPMNHIVITFILSWKHFHPYGKGLFKDNKSDEHKEFSNLGINKAHYYLYL